MPEGKIESIKSIAKMWWEIKLEGVEEIFHLSTNWTGVHGHLKVGDVVQYDDSHENATLHYNIFRNLKKIEPEEENKEQTKSETD